MVNRISRRNFLQLATIGTGSLLLLPACSDLKEVSGWHFFTNEEGTVLEAIYIGFRAPIVIKTIEGSKRTDETSLKLQIVALKI